MKNTVTVLFAALLMSAASASAVTLVAGFDTLNPNASLGTSFTSGGIAFSSPTTISPVSGSFGSTLFGWTQDPFSGTAIVVHNTGWLSITAPGYLIDGVSFKYGMDWNGYLIEYGLMDTTFSWEALLDGAIVDSGSQTWSRDNRTHGGFYIGVNPAPLFDTLLIRSTAVAYQGIYTGGTGPGGWYYERGAAIGYGDQNNIAVDNVVVNAVARAQSLPSLAEAVPDAGSTFALLSCGILVLSALRRRMSTV